MSGAGALSDEDRRLVASTCARRSELELHGAAAFRAVTGALVDLRAEPAILELSQQAVAEELRHSEIYRALATEIGGVEVPPPHTEAIEIPSHADAPPSLRSALRVVAMCAINETIACAFLELCLDGATAPPVRAGLREVLSDEIRHGRIGWAWLSSVSEAERAAVTPFLLPLLRAQLAGFRAQLATLPKGAVPAYGCPSSAAIEAASVRAIGELVLPGFSHLGMDVSASRAWLDDGAAT